jgi:hypothetical protein
MIQNLQFNLPNYIVPRGAMQAMLRRLIREPSSSFLKEFAVCGSKSLIRNSEK